jgi:hypothetical protein
MGLQKKSKRYKVHVNDLWYVTNLVSEVGLPDFVRCIIETEGNLQYIMERLFASQEKTNAKMEEARLEGIEAVMHSKRSI